MGTEMGNYIPEFRERKWKITFPTFGNGIGNEKLILKLWEREWEAGIPGNGQEREFPLTPAWHIIFSAFNAIRELLDLIIVPKWVLRLYIAAVLFDSY